MATRHGIRITDERALGRASLDPPAGPFTRKLTNTDSCIREKKHEPLGVGSCVSDTGVETGVADMGAEGGLHTMRTRLFDYHKGRL